MINLKTYFTKTELYLWISSCVVIIVSFCVGNDKNALTLVASLIGVTSLILNAKGNPLGQGLIIIFSIIYGVISYKCAYYGEMLTYVCMTLPMAIFSLVVWLKHPFNGNKSEVKVNRINKQDILLMLLLSCVVTVVFYFILKFFNTANLIVSTFSVTTSFIAVFLTAKRSPWYAIGYAANDVVLIILWTDASFKDAGYIPVTACFWVFLVNDIYGFINWRRLGKKQNELQNK